MYLHFSTTLLLLQYPNLKFLQILFKNMKIYENVRCFFEIELTKFRDISFLEKIRLKAFKIGL